MSTVAAIPGAPGRDTTSRTRVETHASVLTFDGDRVRKRKKAVRFPFIDLSTPELRLAACHREVDLNRRLAPDIYINVEEIHAGTGTLVDAEVVMRRLPDDRRLATLVSAGADVADELTRIAHVLAAFHGTAARGPDVNRAGTLEGLRHRWDADLDEWEPLVHEILGVATLARERSLIHRYFAGREHLLTRRVDEGHIVDGHGDLLADDIFCMPDGPRILDCLEFDARLRYGDELADVAFLAMDLESMGRPDLAELFARAYQRFAGDNFPAGLLHLYIAQRAMVRSKVACIRVMKEDAGATAAARTYMDLCVRHLEFARPLMIVIGGAPGTGKSTLASRLADTMGWVHLRSDEGLYAADVAAHTYAALADRAGLLLRSGFSVIIDATFSTAESRRRVRRVACDTFTDIVEFECQAPADVIRERAARRQRRRDDGSEAGPAIALALRGRAEPWPDAHPIDTTMTDPAQVVRCLRHIGETPVPDEVE